MRYFQALKDLHNVTFYRLCKQSTGNNSALARLSLRLVAAARLMLLFLHASLDWPAIAFRGHPGRDGREALWAWPRSPPPGPSPSHSWKTWDFAALARGGTWRMRIAVHLCTVIFAIHPRLYTCGEINSDNRRGRHISVVYNASRRRETRRTVTREEYNERMCQHYRRNRNKIHATDK